MSQKIVDSKAYPLKELFADKFSVDFYQREYVWQKKQLEDLIGDLSSEFLKNYREGDSLEKVRAYDPYFMGEIILSIQEGARSDVIDGQQRITTFTLLFIYLLQEYGHVDKFPKGDIEKLVYSDDYGTPRFNLDIPERKACMLALYEAGEYQPKKDDVPSVFNIVERYDDIADCWSERIDEHNVVNFVYWLKEKVVFSKVWTNSDDFAYVIFETMNDRGLSLTQVEMLRSYLLANIDAEDRPSAMSKFDSMVKRLSAVNLGTKSKAENEFFKVCFRGHLAKDLSQAKNSKSDFVRIGSEFHRWVRDNSAQLGLSSPSDFVAFIDKLHFFADVYIKIDDLANARNTNEYLYLVVNSDYRFSLQPALIMASIAYGDSDAIVAEKIKVVSRYLTKVLSWRVWNHWNISQSSLEASIYALCKEIREMSLDELRAYLKSEPLELPELKGSPTLNQQNRKKLRVLISLITEIVAANSGTPDYMLNKKDIEVEHIWSNHYDQHQDEFSDEAEFVSARNNIGDLLVLPKSFNSSYGDDPYESKVQHYIEQNILAQTLNKAKYENNPGFLKFKEDSQLPFEAYDSFKRNEIANRAELYRRILLWNWSDGSEAF